MSGLFPLVQPALQGPPQRQGWFGGGSSPRPGPGGPHGGGMSVNLVVDPRFLPGFGGFDGVHAVAGDAQRREKNKAKRRRRRRRMREERRRAAAQRDSVEGADLVSTSSSSLSLSSLSSDDSDDPWTGSHPRSDGNPQGRTNPRRALFSHLAHESTWRARGHLLSGLRSRTLRAVCSGARSGHGRSAGRVDASRVRGRGSGALHCNLFAASFLPPS